MKVKICGINTKENMETVLRAGADAVGFLVGITHKAEDKISNEEAKQLIAMLPPFVSSVAVTHLTNVEQLIKLVQEIETSTLQIHDYIPPDAVRYVKESLPGVKVIKAVHVMGEEAVSVAKSFESTADALLLDSRTQDRLGGTGMTHDWAISRKIIESVHIPVILAGGLTDQNVYAAVKQVKPYAVDVNSGVEVNSNKDFDKVRRFIVEAHRAEQ